MIVMMCLFHLQYFVKSFVKKLFFLQKVDSQSIYLRMYAMRISFLGTVVLS